MAGVDIEAVKAELRRDAHRRRSRMHAGLRAEASKAACSHFLAQVSIASGEVVAGYWPIRDELDIRAVLAHLLDGGQPLCLPVVTAPDAPLELRMWRDGEALVPAGFGTLAPGDEAPRAIPDLVLVPLLGFDAFGTRLGYGGGYYDRTLAALSRRPRLVGFAFACQQFDDIPRAPHDMGLDAVATEEGVRVFETKDSAA